MSEDRAPPALGDEASSLAAGLWRRLRDVILVAERIETFTFRPGENEPARISLAEGEAEAVALDLVLRALRSAGDRTAWSILKRSAEGEAGAGLEELVVAVGAPRLVVSERVNDLVQVGLVARALEEDRVLATPAGEALVGIVENVVARLAGHVRTARGGAGDDGLSVL